MLKDSDIARYTARRTHRTYTPAFKSELVAACLEPGTSIAALASSHGMNTNVLHRWLKEHAHTGHHQPVASQQPSHRPHHSRCQSSSPCACPTLPPKPLRPNSRSGCARRPCP
ncbi:MAG: transposase [Burkholderiaceae bacterium]|nr:transposase [Burkholderiaceae bacterium]